MILPVPETTHELAQEQGFRLQQVGSPQSCCICDKCIPTFALGYQRPIAGNLFDLWCSVCIETRLPNMVAEGKALR